MTGTEGRRPDVCSSERGAESRMATSWVMEAAREWSALSVALSISMSPREVLAGAASGGFHLVHLSRSLAKLLFYRITRRKWRVVMLECYQARHGTGRCRQR